MISNSLSEARIFYGRHITAGVAEYQDGPTGAPYRILLLEETLRKMDPSYAGQPIVVRHATAEQLDKEQVEIVGHVVESFFNKYDGAHWVKMVVFGDSGLEAIVNNRWKLSNAYHDIEWAGGGRWHNVEYQKQVISAKYFHLAIVPDPRYEESIILTPEDFKLYNAEKESELLAIANSKGEKSMKLSFWKRTAVENSLDIANTLVALKSGRELTIEQIVNELEASDEAKKKLEAEVAAGNHPMANAEHMVECNGEKMSVGQLVEKYNAMVEEKKKAVEEAEAKKNADEEAKKKAEDEKKNAEEEEKKKKEGEKKEGEKPMENSLKHFEALMNAGPVSDANQVLEISADRVARGKQRYGSGN